MTSNVSDINLRFTTPFDGRQHELNSGTMRRNKPTNCIENHINASHTPSGQNGQMNGSKSPGNDVRTKKLPQPNINLSREELLKLLSVFEGELQARDEVIAILKTERPNNPDIQSRYGLCNLPLNALQRDSSTLDVTMKDQVGEQTQEQLKKIIQHHKESQRKLKQMFLASEQTNQRLQMELEEAKITHQDYINKSEDFVSLLEEEREKIKVALDQEKNLHEKKQREFTQRMKDTKEELSRLKSLSLMLVEERQQQLESITSQKKTIAELEKTVKDTNSKITQIQEEHTNEKEQTTQLENDLEKQANSFYQSQEDLQSKLEEEQQKCDKLQAKVNIMTTKLNKLKCVEKNLRKTDDQLWRIHEKLEKDEEHENLLEEVELLRETVKGMQEAEKIYTQAQEEYNEIKNKLETELTLTRQLRVDLKTIQKNAKSNKEFERSMEDTDFKLVDLSMKLEFERKRANDTREQLQKMSVRMKEMEEFEKMVEQSETKILQMREITNRFKDEKQKTNLEAKQLREKNADLKSIIKEEKKKVSEVTEKLIEESRKCLKFKEKFADERRDMIKDVNQLKDKVRILETEKNDANVQKQTQAEESNDQLRRQVIMLKSRLDQIEQNPNKNQTKSSPSKDENKLLEKLQKEYKDLQQKLKDEIEEKNKLKHKINTQSSNSSNNNNSRNDAALKRGLKANAQTPTAMETMKKDKITTLNPSINNKDTSSASTKSSVAITNSTKNFSSYIATAVQKNTTNFTNTNKIQTSSMSHVEHGSTSRTSKKETAHVSDNNKNESCNTGAVKKNKNIVSSVKKSDTVGPTPSLTNTTIDKNVTINLNTSSVTSTANVKTAVSKETTATKSTDVPSPLDSVKPKSSYASTTRRDVGFVGSIKNRYESATLPRNSTRDIIANKAASLRRVNSTRSTSATRSPSTNRTPFQAVVGVKPSHNQFIVCAAPPRKISTEDIKELKTGERVSRTKTKSSPRVNTPQPRVKSPPITVKVESKQTSSRPPSRGIKSPPPVQMTMTHDVKDTSKTSGATIKISMDNKSGKPYISRTESDSGIHIKFNANEATKTTEKDNKMNQTKTSICPSSQPPKVQSSTQEKNGRSSPTMIPKRRGAPSPTPVPYEVVRLKRSGMVAAFRSKLER